MKNKKLITFFAVIILADAMAVFLWLYFYSKIDKQQADINEIVYNLVFSGVNAKNLKMLKSQIDETIGAKEKLDGIFLGKKDIVPFIEYLEKTGEEIGVLVDFSSVKIDDTGKEKPRLQFSLKGKFENIFRFIILLENIRYQIAFENIGLVKNKESGGWEANVGVILTSYKIEK
jgi:hypothetical protein